MTGYTKLFASILHSTIWREPNHVRIVWITLLAMAGKTGIADTSVPGLADAARIPLKDCREALRRLQSPDEDSRSKEYDGRRIEPVEGGFRLINHAKYRAKMNADDRREYLRVKQAEFRTKRRRVNTKSTPVNERQQVSTQSTHAEADTYTETKAEAHTETKEQTHTPRSSRRDAIFGSEHRAHASCGRACVPAFLHRELRKALGGDEEAADRRLRDWYLVVEAEFTDEVPVPADVLKFWRKRFDVEFVTPTIAAKSEAQQNAELEAAVRADLARRPL